jgi:hypothetical protein
VKVMLVLDDACALGGPALSYVRSSGLFNTVDNSQMYSHVGLLDIISCMVEHNLPYALGPECPFAS